MKLIENIKTLSWTKVTDFLKSNRKLIYVVLAAVLILWLLIRVGNKHDKELAQSKLETKVATTQIQQWRNSDSLHVARIAVIEAEKNKSFLKIKSQDSMILFLQSEVKRVNKKLKEGSSVTVVQSNTNVHDSSPTTVTPSIIYKDKFPVYKTSKNTLWSDIAITANNDSIHYDLTIRNKYSVVIGYEKNVPYAEVTNFNPYSETKDMRTYSVMMPAKKRIGVGFHAGYGISATGLSPYIGVGFSYNLFYIK